MPTMSTKPDPNVGLQDEDECFHPCWKTLPDHIILQIFGYLQAPDLHQAGLVCKAWLRVAFDELLWKDLFYRHWQISRSIPMAPGKYSWIQEYKRLLFHTPSVESEVLKQHADQVLHVSFSHNGKMFATCSKDGFIRVWDATYPTSLKYKADMRKFTWKYTQFSQFNATDTLLLVSGVHFGSLSTSGEIAVFSLEGDFAMQSRVMNKPYDVFGTWYNDCYLLSGNLHWTGHLNSCSAIWLNKAFQEASSEQESVVMRLFKFSNINASSIRIIMVANCLNNENEVASLSDKLQGEGKDESLSSSQQSLNLIGGDESANQEAVDMQDEDTEDNEDPDDGVAAASNELSKKKSSKSVQSIQVYENGTFITKFLEVDEDEPSTSNRLNGTIEYSSDYRNAEKPGTNLTGIFKSETSCSELSERSMSTNGNCSSSEGSETCIVRSMSGSDVSEKSTPCLRECTPGGSEMDISKSVEQEEGSGNSASGRIPEREVAFHLSDSSQQLSDRAISPRSNTPFSNIQIYNNDFSPQRTSSSSDFFVQPQNGKASPCLEAGLRCASTQSLRSLSNKSQNDFQNMSFETSPPESALSGSSECSSVQDTPTQKRPMHGQQQLQGEVIQDPSSCDYNMTNNPCSNEDMEGLQFDENAKLAFCCVDYKKPRKVSRGVGLSAVRNEVSRPSQSCVTQTAMCTGAVTYSSDTIEIQSNSDVNVETCIPVKPMCNTISETINETHMESPVVARLQSSKNIENTQIQIKTSCPKSKRMLKTTSKKIITDKYLLFTKGSKTYTPHQIGIKRIKPLKAFNADGSQLLPNVAENTQGTGQPEEYDDVDYLIDMHGHIIGMSLSPDQRYLYVNSRPWPKNYEIENPLYPPPIAQEIDIHVIDLLKMREVGTMHRSHKAYTSNDECFFIFLDVCDEYVASGAEDKHGYLWDRHYGLCLHKYPHSDVVNSVAFNPSDPEVLITVSDDFSIKIWRSLSREKEVVKAFNKEHCIRLKHVQAIMSEEMDNYGDKCLG